MGEYTNEVERVAQAYNIPEKDVIFCYAVAAGAPAPDAYNAIFKPRANTPSDTVERLAADYLRQNPGAKILINRIKSGKKRGKDETVRKVEEGEKDELRTREGVINKLIDNVSACQGKDAVSGLQTLAKLQGFDKPEEVEEEDKRVFVLTYLSRCRSCKLMGAYMEVQKAGEA